MNEPEAHFLEQTGNLAATAGVLMTVGRNVGVGKPTTRPDYLPFGRPDFGDDEIAAVTRVLRSGWVGMGPETITFEQELADACHAPHVVTVNSCTSALFLALLVNGVKPGDEVVVPSLTWISTANAALHLGATPVFCDIDPVTLNATPESVRACLTPRTRAIVVVHLGGLAADVAAIRRVVPAHIAIVEDAAHAFGSRFADGTPVGASGNLTCFSFYANKNLSTGDGGAIALSSPRHADRLRSLRQHALPSDAWKRFTDARKLSAGDVAEVGFKMNFTDLQSSIGRVQLRRQEEFAERRLAIANYYAGAIATMPWDIGVQHGVTDAGHARHLFLTQLPIDEIGRSRNEILMGLRARNIGASVHYAPIHTMPLYAEWPTSLPVTEQVFERVLTLPISASMTLKDARDVMSAFEEELSSGPNHAALMRRVG
ncbi:MAG TPA: DegT/DnrJ/EryC1/StrS family aminotransferase [Vicinamibacterales bacterium]|nr:DegT/DnrJ/EryC1/StrS family aminotransferase [Vicinamibacterales bacterium]